MNWLSRAFGGDARGPRDVDTAMRSALLALLDRDWDTAEELLARAIRLDADGVEAYLALARLYRNRGELGRAIRIHQNLLLRTDLSPAQRETTLLDLGDDFRQGGFLKRAIATYDDLLAGNRRHPGALRAIAPLLAQAGEFDRAIETARRVAKLDGEKSGPLEAVLWVQTARAARGEGDDDRARKALKRALRRDKSCADAWWELGCLEAEMGRSKKALAAWTRVVELDPERGATVYPKLESAYAALDRGPQYESRLRERIEQEPEDGGARRALAALLAARGDVDEAVAELRRLLASTPDDLEARAALARTLLSNDRAAEIPHELGALLDALSRRGLVATNEKPE